MASSNKTENYGLNQWVKSDPVLMDDMNADNKKIDAAMKGLAEEIKAGIDGVKAEVGMVRLGKYTAADGNVNASFDLSGINVNDYSEFRIWVGNLAGSTGDIFMRFNNDGGANYAEPQQGGLTSISIIGSSANVEIDTARVDILCGANRLHTKVRSHSYQTLYAQTTSSESYAAYLGCGGTGLQSIQVYSDGAVGEGAEVVLYGVLK